MTLSRAVRVLTAVVALVAFAALTGCAKKLSAPDSSFTGVEGVTSGDILLVGWQQPSQVEAHWLQSSAENSEPFFSDTTAIAADSVGRRMAMVFDHSIASALEAYRSFPDGALAPMFDYALRPFAKDIFFQLDFFQFQDPSPVSSDQRFVVRGLLNGVASNKSPLSNLANTAGALDQTMIPTSPVRFADSVAVYSWTPDPRAAFYIVNVLDFGEISATRSKAIICGFPTPIYPDPTVGQLTGFTTGTQIPFDFSGGRFPIRLIVRVLAVDENYRIINRVNPGVATLTTIAPTAFEAYKFRFVETAPANFNAFSVLPIGGVKLVFDPFNQDVAPQFAASGPQSAAAPAARVRFSERTMPAGLTPSQVRAIVEGRAGKAAAR